MLFGCLFVVQHGAELTDHSIFAALSSRWETDFHQDMAALNVSAVNMVMLTKALLGDGTRRANKG